MHKISAFYLKFFKNKSINIHPSGSTLTIEYSRFKLFSPSKFSYTCKQLVIEWKSQFFFETFLYKNTIKAFDVKSNMLL